MGVARLRSEWRRLLESTPHHVLSTTGTHGCSLLLESTPHHVLYTLGALCPLLLESTPYHVLSTLGALCCWHELRFTFPSNSMAPQGLADILEEEKPLVADDLRVCDKIPNLSANGKGRPLSHREEK